MGGNVTIPEPLSSEEIEELRRIPAVIHPIGGNDMIACVALSVGELRRLLARLTYLEEQAK